MDRQKKTDKMQDLLSKAKELVAVKHKAKHFEALLVDTVHDLNATVALIDEVATTYRGFFVKKSTGTARSLKIYFFKGENGDWYWRARQSNGKIVAIQGEGLKNKSDSLGAFTNFITKLRKGLWQIK